MTKFFTVTESEIVPLTGFDFGETFQTYTMSNGDYISLYYKANLIPTTNWGLGEVYAQRFNSHGEPVGTEFVVSDATTVDDYYAEMVELNNGQFAIMWYGIINNIPDPANAGNFFTEGQYFVQVFNADGSRSGTTIVVTAQEHYDATLADYTFGINNRNIVKTPNGGFLITYTTYNGTTQTLVAQRYDATGAVVGATTTITTTAFIAGSMETTALPDGGFLMTWRGGSTPDNAGVYAQRFDAAGNKVGDEFLANTFTTSTQTAADVGVFVDGSYIIVWQSNTQDGDLYTVVAQKFSASGTKVGGEIIINTNTTGNQYNPTILTFADGSYVVAWRDTALAGDYFQRFAADGSRMGSEIRLNTTGGARFMTLTALEDGGFVVSWQDTTTDPVTGAVLTHTMRQQVFSTATTYTSSNSEIAPLTGYDFGAVFQTYTMSNGDYISLYYKANYLPDNTNWGVGEVYGQRFNAQGVAVGTEFVISDATYIDDYYAEMVELNNGQFAVVWYGVVNNVPDTANAGYFFTEGQYVAQIFNADGSRSGSTIAVSDTEHFDTALNNYTFGINNRNIVKTPNGGFLITYTTYNGTTSTLVAQRYDATGAQVGATSTITTTAFLGGSMETTALPDGGFLMTWRGGTTADNSGVYAQRFDANGNKVGAEFLANTFITSTQASADVGVFADGSYVITWQSNTQDGNNYAIISQRFNASGVKLGGEVIVNTHTFGSQNAPSIITFSDYSYVIAWRDSDLKGDYYQRFAADGSRIGPETRLNTTGGARSFSMSALANGSFVVSWEDSVTDPVTGLVISRALTQEVIAAPSTDVSGDNYIYGTTGNDLINGGAGKDVISGGNGFDTIYGGLGEDTLNADAGGGNLWHADNQVVGLASEDFAVDFLNGGNGGDVIYAGLGDIAHGGTQFAGTVDRIFVSFFGKSEALNLDLSTGDAFATLATAAGGTYDGFEEIGVFGSLFDDTIIGSEGNDRLFDLAPYDGQGGGDHIEGRGGDDRISAGSGNNYVDGGAGNDIIYNTSFETETMLGGIGNDTFFYGSTAPVDIIGTGADIIDGGDGIDTISYSKLTTGVNVNLSLTTQQNTGFNLLTISNVENIQGTSGNDTLAGDAAGNRLEGGLGNDQFYGGNGADTLLGGVGDDSFNGDEGNDTISGDEGSDLLYGNIGSDSLFGGADNDHLSGGDGDDELNGNGGNDIIFGDAGNDIGYGEAGLDTILGGEGNDTLHGGLDNDALDGGDDNDTLYGDEGDDGVLGGAGDDILSGGDGNDNINGGVGNDFMTGDAGNDQFYGGDGADLLLGGIGDDSFNGDEGDDTLSGDEGSDLLYGNDGNDSLNGGDDNDHLSGGDGDDELNGNDGADLIFGDAGSDTAYGEAGLDTMLGGGGSDALHGGSDNDTLDGGNDNDTLYGDEGDDSVLGGSGDDILSGGDGIDSLNGGTGNDIVSGDAGNDLLDGGDGIDILVGGEGVDTILGGTGNDGIGAFDGESNTDHEVLDGGYGNDLIDADAYDIIEGGIGTDRVSIDFDSYGTVTGTAINLDLNAAFAGGTLNLITGGSVNGAELVKVWATTYNDTIVDAAWNGEINAGGGDDSVDGGAGNDAIMGGQGSDTIVGGIGNDWLFGGIDNDTVSGGDGNDRIGDVTAYLAQFSQAASILDTNYLGDFQLESYSEYEDNGNDSLAGGAGNDTIYAWGGDDTLDGGIGADKLYGGTGDDSYYIDNNADLVTENADEGIDTVISLFTRTLGANFENLTLTGASATNGIGNELDNIILGSSSNNQLFGMLGNDTLNGGAGLDVLVGGDGDDTLDGGADRDQLKGGNGNDNLFGGDTGDSLKGEAGNDYLDGGSGADTFYGGAGDDTYVVDDALDFLFEVTGEGYDSVVSSITYTLRNYFEDLSLTGVANINGIGNTENNVITGNDGNNQLFGMFGNDTIYGGLGNDTVVGGDSNDTLYGEDGNDQLKGGYGNDSLFGGAGNDNLKGEENHDYIDGGLGVDSMYGGAGNDTYVASELGDFYVENLNEGTDTILASITFTLGNNLENLTLTGAGNINGTGNAGFNVLLGNAGNNTLSGMDGTDRITGGAGNDTLLGGNGNDTYYFDLGFGQDEINDAVGTNRITFGAGISATDVITEVVGADLYVALKDVDPLVTASNATNRIRIIGGATVAPTITYTPPAIVAESSALSAAITTFTAPLSSAVTLVDKAADVSRMKLAIGASSISPLPSVA